MSRPVRIGLDCDGVLYDQVDAFRWWIHHSTGRSLDELGPATAWHFYRDDWGYTLPEFLDMFTAGVRAGAIFGQGAPLPGTVRSLQRLREAGHRLIVVTNREIAGIDLAVTEQLTRTWLDTWQLPIDDLVISADKTVADVDLFLEDSIDNYDAIDRHGHAIPVLFDRPWNQDNGTRWRVSDWVQFEDFAQRIAAELGRAKRTLSQRLPSSSCAATDRSSHEQDD